MNNKNREIVLLMRSWLPGEKAMEREMEQLDRLLSRVESPELFCITHELVRRNYITRKGSAIKKIYYQRDLKPFWFLISKN